MACVTLTYFFIVSAALVHQSLSWTNEEIDDFSVLMKLLNKPKTPERIQPQFPGYLGSTKSVQVNSFSWTSCGGSSDIVQIQSLNLSPDPLKIPGNVTVSASGTLRTMLQSPISVDLEIKKKVLLWITVPCIDDVGSCHYDDVCSMLSKFPCPPEFKTYGIPCSCPVKPGTYKLPPTSVYADPSGIPSWAKSGDYKVQAKLNYKGKEVVCLNMEMSIA